MCKGFLPGKLRKAISKTFYENKTEFKKHISSGTNLDSIEGLPANIGLEV